ncbi:probable aspartic proteinase GIP2 [Pistacia vera]|uniref:probable aspartic proteinase GIP2 n=1 Tax=Pistacia vera TaxID=55513 RepID=UPI001262B5B4|nr:probable aspartic proteinase GIP2 [Pistacia vera]
MVSSNHLTIFFLLSLSFSLTQQSSKPKALLLPVSKDTSTLLYLTHLNLGTPFIQKSLVVDLGGRYLWIECTKDYKSSTHKLGSCGSAPCSVAHSDECTVCLSGSKPKCLDRTKRPCYIYPENTLSSGHAEFGNLSMDRISLQSRDSSTSGPLVTINSFIFACATHKLLLNLAKGVKGMLGLGRHPAGLPIQLSSAFGGSLRRKFAVCLPSKSKTNGVIFFGDSNYLFYPDYNTSKAIDLSSMFTYIRLVVNPASTSKIFETGEASADYFVGLRSVMVNKKIVPFNSSLLTFNKWGFGGTKLSTVNPYSVRETSIYSSLVKVFDEEIIATHNVSKVAAVEPFTECYTIGQVGVTLTGLDVPYIRLVFEDNTYWELHGANSMVQISRDVMCLGFLDGGDQVTIPIVIGAHQLQDNLLQFDLDASKLGFTSTLLSKEIKCSNFKF